MLNTLWLTTTSRVVSKKLPMELFEDQKNRSVVRPRSHRFIHIKGGYRNGNLLFFSCLAPPPIPPYIHPRLEAGGMSVNPVRPEREQP